MIVPNFPELFRLMIGGDEAAFITTQWRREVHFTQAALPSQMLAYTCDSFVDDYKRTKPLSESLIVSIDSRGTRNMGRPSDEEAAERALARDASLVLQAYLLPDDQPNMPEAWLTFKALHRDLCSYLLPGFPQKALPGTAVASIDIFYTGEKTSTGGHYDTGDVFYFVLEGEKEWTIELVPDPETVLRLFQTPGKYMKDHPPQREHRVIRVRPGDCLYVPPFTYHRVQSDRKSLALSLGLPAYTEATMLKQVLERLQRERLIWEPLPSYPSDFVGLFEKAKAETTARTAALLNAIDQEVRSISSVASRSH